MNPIQFMRMAKWARRPASTRRVKLVFGIIALCFALFLIERYVGWPDFLSVEAPRRLRPTAP